MMAKRKELCRPIMDSFMNGEVDKKYLCVVDGYRDEELQGSFSVDAPIQRHEVKFMREVGDSNADSKPAETLYTIMDKSCDKRMMLLSAKPRTGRTHQIRLHAKKCSLPIVGDDLYNPREYVRKKTSAMTTAAMLTNILCFPDMIYTIVTKQ